MELSQEHAVLLKRAELHLLTLLGGLRDLLMRQIQLKKFEHGLLKRSTLFGRISIPYTKDVQPLYSAFLIFNIRIQYMLSILYNLMKSIQHSKHPMLQNYIP